MPTLILGLLVLFIGACDSHTPLVNATAREAYLAARDGSRNPGAIARNTGDTAPENQTQPQRDQPITDEVRQRASEEPSAEPAEPIDTPPTSSPPVPNSPLKFMANPTRHMDPSTLQASTNTNFPYLREGERIPVIFPLSMNMGAAYMVQTKMEPGVVTFDGGPYAQKKFKIVQAGRNLEAAWPSVDKSTPALTIQNRWNHDIPHLLYVRGDIGKDTFYLLRKNKSHDEHSEEQGAAIGEWKTLPTRWGAYLLDPDLEQFAEKYDFADVWIEKQDEKVRYLMRRFGNTPWVDIDVTGAELHPFDATLPDGLHIELCCAWLEKVPILVGEVTELRGGKTVETWFVAFPTTLTVPPSSAAGK